MSSVIGNLVSLKSLPIRNCVPVFPEVNAMIAILQGVDVMITIFSDFLPIFSKTHIMIKFVEKVAVGKTKTQTFGIFCRNIDPPCVLVLTASSNGTFWSLNNTKIHYATEQQTDINGIAVYNHKSI
jgi:hypothetical protein